MTAKLINVTSQAVLESVKTLLAIAIIIDASGQRSSTLQALALVPFLSVN